ncbi:MAG: hypothetical protein GY778_24560 [bacterium]|nr:hypothetical protein [bacterium]
MSSKPAGMILLSAACAILALGFAADGKTDVATADISQAEIETAFGLSDSVTFDLEFEHGPGEAFDVVVPLAGQSFTLVLYPHSVRADGFRVIVQLDDGSFEDIEPAPERTFRGTVVGVPGSDVAASITDHGLKARIFLGEEEEYWVEPVAANIPEASREAYVSYAATDVIPNGGVCGLDDLANPSGDGGGGGTGGGREACGGPLCEAELAIDADWQYYVAHGSNTTNVENAVQSVINNVNIQYERDVEITHRITTIIIRTSSASNPYTTNDSSALLNQVRTEWEANMGHIQRDMAEMFTGRNITGSVIGIAWLNAVCGSFGYSVVQSDCCGSGACASDLSAHELGHNWGADHCSCSTYTMNSGLTCANRFQPNDTIPEIIGFRDAITGCLSIGGDTEPPQPNPMTFVTPPFATGSDSIGMVATTAIDDLNVEYYFDNTSGGAGADDSGWIGANAYVDSGLTPNTTYAYRTRAQDVAFPPNVGAYSSIFAATTLAEVPPAPLVGNSAATTLDVDPETGSNPASTEFAIDVSSVIDAVWDGFYVDASGNPSATPVWQTNADWGTTTVNGLLEGGIEYCFRVKARNGEGVESGFSPTACDTTLADPQTIVSAWSCMDHAGQRWCLNLDGGGIEPRWNPLQLEFDLSGNAAGVAATLDCASGNGGPATATVSAGLNGPQSHLTLDFAPLPNVDCCTVTLTGGVEDVFDFQVLAGDVNGSGSVNATDKNLVKGNLNRAVDATRFFLDVNTSNSINATDKNLTKGWIGNTTATCP